MPLSVESISKKRVKLLISGIVQGVGFRPFIYNLAQRYSIKGFVLNNGSGVTIEAQAKESSISAFIDDIKTKSPPLSRIDKIDISEIDTIYEDDFLILHSDTTRASTMLPADISICDDCKAEMNDTKNRRYRYPFINCTNCGPRYTIISSLPYDRKNSSMNSFKMCKKCKAEYEDPTDRRYHAQPISCYECGPKLQISSKKYEEIPDNKLHIFKISSMIKDSQIVAIKGIGGFHIVCDATDTQALKRLRLLKNRPTKPFAVMFKDIDTIREVAYLSQKDEELILSKERPIVILKKRKESCLASEIAPNIDRVGVFLAYTPLHELLLDELNRPIVATSANLSDEPIIRDNGELFEKLPTVVQSSLNNDREILNACDDSVVMSICEDESVMLRLSRGYAPKSFYLQKKSAKKILALGANQKSTITLLFDNSIVVSPHIGDLNSIGAVEYFLTTVETFKNFYDFKPDIIVCDKHPNYETSKWAKEYVSNHNDIELLEVQHHYAHALSCMAEYNLKDDMLAFCFDGTGYGDDGTLWGGEVLLANTKSYKRLYHLKEFSLLGGEKAIKEPKRVALSILFDYFTLQEIKDMDIVLLDGFSPQELQTLHLMKEKSLNTHKSSSIGRLFDAIYALSGNLNPLAYEGESGLVMESCADKFPSDSHYHYNIVEDVIEYKEMILEILDEKNRDIIASKFINTIIEMIIDISKRYNKLPIILSGGVFQNRVLLEGVIKRCKKENIRYFIQKQTPVNDGGISLGQAYHAFCTQG
jgi:hydrogenase maturation protein HypF